MQVLEAERWRLAGWFGGVSPPPRLGSAEVPNQQFGGGKRVAARDAATSAGEDASAPVVFLECGDVLVNRFADVCNRFLSGSALRHASRKARTLRNPIAIFTRIDHHLSHDRLLRLIP